MTAKPFLKWVGGKRRLLPEILKYVPAHFEKYHEPFLGGGALFFALAPKRAILSDRNRRLVRTYRGVREDVEEVISRLSVLENDKETFLRERAREVDDLSDPAVAAWFIYLNKTGFNGLYRVNSKNVFNVPFGDMKNPNICDRERLLDCANALYPVTLLIQDFTDVPQHASPGDFVYFDPPYVPISASSAFVSYTQEGFSMEDQRKLVEIARALKERGVHVLLSNSAAPAVYELYRDGFEIIEVETSRLVGAQASSRGSIKELLIR